jgi:alkanesulfonate monooxygenase SsuD/methylene tetrahydromethanopterin reductase-like flavin-dependent oxidoreductase (luciferase family)
MFSNLPPTLAGWHEGGFVAGSPQQILDQLKAFEAAGVERFMLQQNDLDDVASLELLAAEVLPHFS